MERDREVEILHHKDNLYEKDMMERLSQVMELYEGLEHYLSKSPYKNGQVAFGPPTARRSLCAYRASVLEYKKEKEEIESALKTYIGNTTVRHAECPRHYIYRYPRT
jgi:hypothetical protein